MNLKHLLTKALLVVAMLGGGTTMSWGDITYNTTLVNQNFSDVTNESANWSTGSGMALAKTLRSGTDYYYTLSFGNSGNAASTADYSLPSLSGYEAYQLSFLWGLYSCSSSSRSSLFKIVSSSGDFATTGSVAGQSSSVTLTCGETSTSLDIDNYNTSNRGNANRTSTLYKITIEGISSGDDAGIYMTITSEDGETTKLAKTKISSTYQTITKLHFESGQYYGQQAIDDILLQAYSASDVVSAPSIAITGVSGTNRTVTITAGTSSMGNDVTTYYTTDGTDPTDVSTEYTSALTITEDCTVKAISKTSAGTSEVGSLAVKTGAVTLASPSVALSSYVLADASYIMSPTFAIYEPNNSGVLLTPATETLEYTFTPEGGSESARTAITSGGTYTPTAKGTLTVYANATGYSESSYTIPVSNYYSVSTTLDYTGLYTEAQDEWTASANDWGTGYTAYTVHKSTWPNSGATYNRLNIRNDNTIDYVVGFGFGRFGNSYSFRIRNQVKGNFFNVISSTVAAEPTTTNGVVLCTSGSGEEGDVANTPSIATKNVIMTIYEYEPSDAPTVTKTITSAGWATYCSPYALDFSSAIDNLDAAYIVTGGANGVLNKTEVTGTVPANTGLLLKGEGECAIPVAASSTTDVSANIMTGVTTATEIAAEAGWVLMASPSLGFYKNTNAFTVGANTAYIPTSELLDPTTARKYFSLFADETTGIANVSENVDDDTFVDLSGRRVAKPTKGLYIVNGKKVLVK